MVQSANLNRIVNGQQTPNTTCIGESMSLSEHNSSKGNVLIIVFPFLPFSFSGVNNYVLS